MTYGTDDAFGTCIVIRDDRTGDVVPMFSVRMFPPAPLAKRAFRQLVKRVRFEVVRCPVISWRPRSNEISAHVAVARNGRTVVTASESVLFDNSVAALVPDAIEKMWMTCARERARVLVFVGGPARLQNLADLEQAAGDGLLVGGWADVSLPELAAE